MTVGLSPFTLILDLSEMLRASSDHHPVFSDSPLSWLVQGTSTCGYCVSMGAFRSVGALTTSGDTEKQLSVGRLKGI